MSLFKRKEKVPEGFKTPSEFYLDCVEDFHKEANEHNAAMQGVILVPELIPLGEKAVLALLKDKFYEQQFGSSPEMYYYFILAMSIDCGLVFADRWHTAKPELDAYVSNIMQDGPADDANKLFDAEFPEPEFRNQANPFFSKIFSKWMELHEPYWQMKDPRDYTYKAMLAGYQLGVSMMLDKYGYK